MLALATAGSVESRLTHSEITPRTVAPGGVSCTTAVPALSDVASRIAMGLSSASFAALSTASWRQGTR